MLMCAQAPNDIMRWAGLNPHASAALETRTSGFLAEHLLRKEDFNDRTPAASFHAVHTTRVNAAEPGLGMTGPAPNSVDAPLTLAR